LACALFAHVDQNRTELSDVCEFIYFCGTVDPFADANGEGANNFDEILWGTNATSQITGTAAMPNGNTILRAVRQPTPLHTNSTNLQITHEVPDTNVDALYTHALGNPLDASIEIDSNGLPDGQKFQQGRNLATKDPPAVGWSSSRHRERKSHEKSEESKPDEAVVAAGFIASYA